MSAVLRVQEPASYRGQTTLTAEQFRNWSVKLALNSEAIRYIESVRASPPSRLVGQYAHWSNSGDYQSAKMGHSVESESDNAEWVYIHLLEFMKKCLEYHAQPASVTVTDTYANGRKVTHQYTTDFLVMLEDDVFVVECKTESKLQELIVERPTDWKKDETGYFYQPAKDAFEKLGLKHIVFSSNECTKTRFSNLALLLQAKKNPSRITDELGKKVVGAFSNSVCLRLSELIAACGVEDITPILQLIAGQVLHTRIDKDLLIHPSTAWIASDPIVFEQVDLPDERGKSGTLESIAFKTLPRQNAFDRALRNLDRLNEPLWSGRSKRHWRSKIRVGIATGLSHALSLVPDWPSCGNRRVTFNPTQLEFFDTYFKEHYCKPGPKRIMAAYAEYECLAQKAHPHYKPMGRDAFTKRIDARKQEAAAGQGGIRAEMAAAQPTNTDDQSALATRANELAHIDHHKTDVFVLVVGKSGRAFAARCWFTVMVDAKTGMILAIWLSLRSPSHRACAMAIRRCVREYGKLPENIRSDYGPEFDSTFYLELLAYVVVNRRHRPSGNARYGSEAERLFKIFIDVFSSRLPGRVQNILKSRSVSKSHSAERNATLSAEEFYEYIEMFRRWYNTEYVAPHEDRPPQELHDFLMKLCSCSGVPVTYDYAFEIATAVDSTLYTVDPNKGFHSDIGWYWHPTLTTLSLRKSKRIEVREDPEDPYRTYAAVNGNWITCRNRKDASFVNKPANERYGEALRLLDGAVERRSAKKDADAKLTKFIIESEQARNEKLKAPRKVADDDASSPPNPFDRLRKRKPGVLTISKWGKKS
jgi:putative transposase